ncbi:threonine-phosphate decarboxylase CobD [Hyphomonas pacifica]|uniref:threonine-phosphate decarboxylase CobD n=1 Tax=Hyphomonas pacifica TaxID=1280941 RepID=UPI000DBFAFE3|nr:threonine-phosphate decarboxylase CobD [Hyphomonas pacifica]RAN34512.1 hypothetical protein HY11_14950 [Hyphomonas pacifica]
MNKDLIHGGALDVMQLKFPNVDRPWIDLSTGINPWAYPIGDISAEATTHLPTRNLMHRCRAAMARALNGPEEALVLSPGSELLIRLLPSLLTARRVAILSPTYGDHRTSWLQANCQVLETSNPLDEADRADVIVMCNPNNPDGNTFSPSDLEDTRYRLAKRGGWLIVDEAYADLAPDLSMVPHAGKESLIVLRSFGKFFGLAGLRLGGAFVPKSLRTKLEHILGMWPVSCPALEIGTRAYGDHAWQMETRQSLAKAKRRLDGILMDAGHRPVGGTDLFRLIEVEHATKLWMQLAERGVYVRRFEWSNQQLRIGLPADSIAEGRLAFALIP